LNRTTLMLILSSVALSALAQVVLKAGMSGAPAPAIVGPVDKIAASLQQPMVWAGLFVYFMSALVWLLVLARIPVSLAYPFVGLGFVVTMVIARFALGEPFTVSKVLGTLLIAGGIAVMARG